MSIVLANLGRADAGYAIHRGQGPYSRMTSRGIITASELVPRYQPLARTFQLFSDLTPSHLAGESHETSSPWTLEFVQGLV